MGWAAYLLNERHGIEFIAYQADGKVSRIELNVGRIRPPGFLARNNFQLARHPADNIGPMPT
jgi:hypothetical protein